MTRFLAFFTILMLASSLLLAAPKSAVLVFPPGSGSQEALYRAAGDLLRRTGYQLDETVPGKKIRASLTYYDSISPARAGTTPSTLSWALELKAEQDGRILVTLRHEVQGWRKPDYIPLFAQNLTVGAGASVTKAVLTYEGKTKPLQDWRPVEESSQ